jgi:hypothetical protein
MSDAAARSLWLGRRSSSASDMTHSSRISLRGSQTWRYFENGAAKLPTHWCGGCKPAAVIPWSDFFRKAELFPVKATVYLFIRQILPHRYKRKHIIFSVHYFLLFICFHYSSTSVTAVSASAPFLEFHAQFIIKNWFILCVCVCVCGGGGGVFLT